MPRPHQPMSASLPGCLSCGSRADDSGLLVHCISGWDRTPLFISLLRLSLWAVSMDRLGHGVGEQSKDLTKNCPLRVLRLSRKKRFGVRDLFWGLLGRLAVTGSVTSWDEEGLSHGEACF